MSEEKQHGNDSITNAMSSVLTELYNELLELNDIVKNVDYDSHEYYLGKINGVERSIQIIEKYAGRLDCTSKAHNFSLSKIGICLECKSKEPIGAK